MKKNNYIYGFRSILEAIESGQSVDKVLFKKNLRGELYNKLFAIVNKNNIPFQFVPIEKINRLTQKNHQGVIGFLSLIEYTNIEELTQMIIERGDLPFILILDGITDVRNFGAIVRTAECAGVHAVVIKSKGSAQINNDAIKTSAGALYKMPVARVENLDDIVKFLQDSGLCVVVATEKAEKYHYNIDFNVPLAIIMGSEEDGISPKILNMVDFQAKIPILGEIESLNVSNAASVLMYETVRQRQI